MKYLKYIFVIITIIVSYFILKQEDSQYKETIRKNEELRKQLEYKSKQLEQERRLNALHREKLKEKIKESEDRFNQYEKEFRKNESSLKSELERVKNSSVKNLQDEAERIYSSGCKH